MGSRLLLRLCCVLGAARQLGGGANVDVERLVRAGDVEGARGRLELPAMGAALPHEGP
jgi:hypothetical protein